MSPDVSVVVPAHNEEDFIGDCLQAIKHAAKNTNLNVETVVVLNRCTDKTGEIAEAAGAQCIEFDEPCIAAIRNTGIRASTGSLILTIDADSLMAPQTIAKAWSEYQSGRAVGGDTGSVPERWSIGIIFSVLAIVPYLIGRGISGGSFWFSREAFNAIGGFDERLLSVEDFDFGKRLKAYGRTKDLKYIRLKSCRITTSCRKFDQFGDWYLFKNPRLVRRIFKGNDREAVDDFYYKTGR